MTNDDAVWFVDMWTDGGIRTVAGPWNRITAEAVCMAERECGHLRSHIWPNKRQHDPQTAEVDRLRKELTHVYGLYAEALASHPPPTPEDIPIDDGSDKPLGYTSEDGWLEVRENEDGSKCYHETALGQHQRWMRQAPDLYELYQNAIMRASHPPPTPEAR